MGCWDRVREWDLRYNISPFLAETAVISCCAGGNDGFSAGKACLEDWLRGTCGGGTRDAVDSLGTGDAEEESNWGDC
jgi:hypothetical protein